MLKIRTAVENDAIPIAQFQVDMAMETEEFVLDSEIVRCGVNKVFDDPTKGKYYVAEDDGTVVASLLTTYEWSDWRCGTVLWIQSVYVLPSYRRKGVYAAMYKHVMQIVENDETLKGIRLYVDKRNEKAQAVYSKLGMNGEHYTLFEWMPED